ncbi:hypothetical protein RHGRI_002071 [Rhododendron griersonianum]|uniref:Uncharacterized protein n=1 Tax=Rhododendron griersonianum TaxID=479676 RepID=A0AAV6LME4_9ERIC|nr:hypothetical protein RHGRI_002071 [Rhododendron griersonianum]
MSKKDRMINALRKDVQLMATAIHLRSPSPSRGRYRSPSARRTEGRNNHVRDCLGKRVGPMLGTASENEWPPYDERIPSLSSVRSEVRGDVRDMLRPPKEYRRHEVPEESSCSFYNLAHTVSHKTEVDHQRDRRSQKTWPCIGSRPEGKTELSKGSKAVHSIQKGKCKERWGEQGGSGYQREYIRGPKPHEFEAGTTVSKDLLHELLKKIEREPYFSYPADDIPCPKPKDTKFRCSYHAKRGHLTTWCPQFKEYLQELVRKGHLAEYIDQEKTREKAGEPKTPSIVGSAGAGPSSVPAARIINVIHGMV